MPNAFLVPGSRQYMSINVLTIIPAISTSQEVPPMNAMHCSLGCGAACRKHCNNNSIDNKEDAIPFHMDIDGSGK